MTTTKLGVIPLAESQQWFRSQPLWNTNDKNGFQSFLNACDFSVWRVASFGHVLYFNH